MHLPARSFQKHRRRQNAEALGLSRRVNGNTIANPSPITHYQRDSVRQRYNSLIMPSGGCMSLKSNQDVLPFPIMIMLGFTMVFAALTPPRINSVDGNTMLVVAESLPTHRSFTAPSELGVSGVGGQIYGYWYPMISVLALPFVHASLLASCISDLPIHYSAAVFSLLLVDALTAATSAVIASLMLWLGGDRKRAWLAAVSYCVGTVALAYGSTFYAESLLEAIAQPSVRRS